MHTIRTLTMSHIREHATIYLFMTLLFLTGIIFGAVIVNSMNFMQKEDLFFYVERFFGQISDDGSVAHLEILQNSYIYHGKYLLLLFILGLSVIGLPIVWILLFLKGIVVGFSVGFIVNQLGLKGLLLAGLSIAPQNLVIIPVYIVAGSLAMLFSLLLLNKLFSQRFAKPVFGPLKKYSVMFAALVGIAFIGSALEAFVANPALESVINAFY